MKKVFLLLGLISCSSGAETYPSYGIGINMGYQPMYPSMQQPYGYDNGYGNGYGNGATESSVQNGSPKPIQNVATDKKPDSVTVDKAAALLKKDLGINPDNDSKKVKLTPQQIKEQQQKLALKKIDKNNDKSLDTVFSESYPTTLYYPEEITLKDH
jgi:hypothetical protein